jgi:hypothetical protein
MNGDGICMKRMSVGAHPVRDSVSRIEAHAQGALLQQRHDLSLMES